MTSKKPQPRIFDERLAWGRSQIDHRGLDQSSFFTPLNINGQPSGFDSTQVALSRFEKTSKKGVVA
jgi:hypothetical protein